MARAPVSTAPQTKASRALEQNLRIISHMLALGRREIAAVNTAARRRTKTLRADLAKGREKVKLLLSLDRFDATLDLRLAQLDTAMLWQVVMLVTCIEAY